jgi:hypothetical protein
MQYGITYSVNGWRGDGEVGKDSVDGEAKEESDGKECGVHLEYTRIWAGGFIRKEGRWRARGRGGMRAERKI